jgi:Domain of unknown function (DUF6457)
MTSNVYEWAGEAVDALDLPEDLRWLADRETVGAVLDLARDVAHAVARPAAPVAAFLAGAALSTAPSPDRSALEAMANRLRDTLPLADDD